MRTIEILDAHIEYAEKTKKFHDAGNFELIKANVEKLINEVVRLSDIVCGQERHKANNLLEKL